MVVRTRAAFLMYPCGSGLFKSVCVLVEMILLGLIMSFLVFCGTLWDFVV